MGTRGFDLFGRALWSFSTMGVYPSFFFSLLLATWLGGQETHCKALSKVGAFFQGECLAWSWSSVTGYKCDQELNTDPVDLDKFRQDSLAAHKSRRRELWTIGTLRSRITPMEKSRARVDQKLATSPRLWKGSTEVGVGVAQEGSTVVVVANYSP